MVDDALLVGGGTNDRQLANGYWGQLGGTRSPGNVVVDQLGVGFFWGIPGTHSVTILVWHYFGYALWVSLALHKRWIVPSSYINLVCAPVVPNLAMDHPPLIGLL